MIFSSPKLIMWKRYTKKTYKNKQTNKKTHQNSDMWDMHTLKWDRNLFYLFQFPCWTQKRKLGWPWVLEVPREPAPSGGLKLSQEEAGRTARGQLGIRVTKLKGGAGDLSWMTTTEIKWRREAERTNQVPQQWTREIKVAECSSPNRDTTLSREWCHRKNSSRNRTSHSQVRNRGLLETLLQKWLGLSTHTNFKLWKPNITFFELGY